ncbi:hypothetical protein SARC_05643 [Sphaeroforma arctica JP610]|uniref:Gamma-glutamyltransferase n=1 Tax=Sphaeroforma arctica JP610 TaxID=667725 RepID=A0A0L0FZU5_9EUKA|nr:hypothetical protein SARC_05643 [Sphaeroforma arctica JP610]KNC82071.1 hypothetical protein SARC_05643 [Sphaeroforma arctica JP610]|eukprot:XP_014155973.1 hypothetical protein SARC_05643 [Sphaeroforma arctica JP610]
MTCASANINSSDMFSFSSRRSNVFSTHGMVGSSQPLASEIGLSVLKRGGNAADAAVAMAAALNVTEDMYMVIAHACWKFI